MISPEKAAAAQHSATRSVFRSMLGLHAWAGLTLGWISFLIFLTGTLAYFQPEITQWMQPELRQPPSTQHAVAMAIRRLTAVAPTASEWNIGLPGDRDPSLAISWRASDSDRLTGRELLNAATGEPVARRDTLGGRLFYSFHFTLMLPGIGYWIVGAAAMLMLVAVVSGLIVHRKILSDFFTFRPRHSPRRASLDVHNVTSLFALPFHVAIVYTGLVTLLFSYVPSILETAYPDDGRSFFREAFEPRAADTALPAHRGVALADLATTIYDITAAGHLVADLQIAAPNTEKTVVTIGLARIPSPTFATERNASAVANVYDSLYEFHLGRFADWPMRWLLFSSGLAGSAMIATGLLVWSLKRQERATSSAGRVGCFLVDRLNVAVIAGVMIAIAVFFLANRLLPLTLADRGAWELRCFFWSWAAAGLHAFLRPLRCAWREQLWALSVAFVAVPAVSGITTGRHLIVSAANADWLFIAFDVASLTVAAVAGATAWKLTRTTAHTTTHFDRIAAGVPGR